MPTCSSCGEYVTRDFVCVFGIDGAVRGCPDCSTFRELHDGDGVGQSTAAGNQSQLQFHLGH